MRAKFIEPMLLPRTDKLPEGDAWAYEIKFDGYRALAFNQPGAPRSAVRPTLRRGPCSRPLALKRFSLR